MIEWKWILIAASSIVYVLSGVPYLYAIFKKKVRPSKVSWFLWLLLGVFALISVLKSGGTYQAIYNLAAVTMVTIILMISLFKGKTVFTKVDAVALVGGLASFSCLFIFNSPLLAMWLVIITDLIAYVPTWVKSWQDPASESTLTFGMTFVGAALGLLAVLDEANYIFYLYPLYLTIANGAELAILLIRKNKKTLWADGTSKLAAQTEN